MALRIFFVIYCFFLSACASNDYVNSLTNNNKIAIFYNAHDSNSKELIDYALDYTINKKLDVRFVTIDVSIDNFSYLSNLHTLSKARNTVIITMLNKNDAKELDKALSKFNFALLSTNDEPYSYGQFLDISKFYITDLTQMKQIDNNYRLVTAKNLPLGSRNMFKILSITNDIITNESQLDYKNYQAAIK